MIEESEKLKTSMESKASHLADKLVPYTLLGTGQARQFGLYILSSIEINYKKNYFFMREEGKSMEQAKESIKRQKKKSV